MSGRVKKFDKYRHNVRTTKRVYRRPQINGVVKLAPTSNNSSLARSTIDRNRLGVTRPAQKRTQQRVITNDTNAPRSFNRSSSVIKSNDRNIVLSTHELALQAVGNTQTHKGSIISSQFTGVIDHKPSRTKMHMAMYIVAAIVFLFSSAVSVQTFVINGQNKQQIEEVLGENSVNTTLDEQGVVEGTGNQPAEKTVPASAIDNYRIANPEEPRALRIPSLGVYARIKSLGETPEGAVAAPRNLNDVGWYDGSARPGNSRGSSLLLGHVSGWTADGVFKHIDKLDAGTIFEVEKGNGTKVKYQVTKSKSIPVDSLDMGKILTPEVSGEHDLKLMTCSGKYNRDTKLYEERFVVYAKIIR